LLLSIDRVVRTKIVPPRRRVGLLHRPRLVDFLHENLNRKVLLLSAPPGYGKTSLLVDFLQEAGLRFTWYSMDGADADPWTFLSHLAASVVEAFPEVREHLLASLSGTVAQDSSPEMALQILANEIQSRIPDYFLLVIDDFHHTDGSQPVRALVNWLLDHLPDNCCLILASRSMPELPYLKLAAKQEIAGLGGKDLAFTADEIRAYLAGNHQLSVSLEEAQRLATESEGWITGILLGTHTLWKGLLRSISEAKGTEAQVFAYLAQEVFAQQPEPTRRFLKATSILDVMRPAFCDALLGIGNSAELLESLEQANLFVGRLSGEEKVYRYHALFQEFLVQQLEADGEQVGHDLHARAARLEEQGGNTEQALEHYLRIGSETDSVRVLESLMETAYQAGRLDTLGQWLDRLGGEAVGRHVQLLAMRGRLCRQKGAFDAALAYYAEARELYLKGGDRCGEATVRIREALVHRYRGALEQARLICEDVLAHYPEIAGDLKTQAQAHRILGEVHHIAGQLPKAKDAFRRSLRLFEQAGDLYQAAALHQALGTTARRMGNPLEAEGHYTRALKILQQLGNRWRVAEIQNNIGVGHYYQGEYEPALQVLERALVEAREVGHHHTEAAVLASLGDVHVDLANDRQAQQLYLESLEGTRSTRDFVLEVYVLCALANLYCVDQAWDQAHAFLDEAAALPIPEGPGYLRGLLAQQRGIVLLDQGNAPRALTELEAAESHLQAAGAKRELARAFLWHANAHYRSGDSPEAFNLLDQAIDLCVEIAHPNLFVADGRRMLPLLDEARKHDERHREWLGRLLTRIHQMSITPLHRPEAEVTRQVHSPRVEVRALGSGNVSVNGSPIAHTAWGGPLVKELFFYLVDHGSVRREAILGTFWPEYSTAKAKSVFHATVYRMRRVLPEGVIGYSAPEETYVVERAADTWYDVAAFEDLVNHARKQDARTAGLLEEALAIYRGPYLSDVYSEWAAGRRQQLHQAYIDVLTMLARIRMASGDAGAAIGLYRKALLEEPYREDLHRELMKTLEAAGRPAEALQHHQTLVELLRRELNTGPTEETEQLFRSILSRPEASA
jgi:ATP/maltotriose-dependent transcriptional regulator MalT/DNA-binding SARP family transcriptional activator